MAVLSLPVCWVTAFDLLAVVECEVELARRWLLVASPAAGDNKTMVQVHFGWAASASGRVVVIVPACALEEPVRSVRGCSGLPLSAFRPSTGVRCLRGP